VYDKYCFYCHGREGRGDGAIGIAVSPHPADFVGDERKMAKSDDELIKSISEGIKRDIGSEEMAMPRWKDILSEEDMWNALAYVRELSRGKK
jgi:mono/diheme cytochrome c family protein